MQTRKKVRSLFGTHSAIGSSEILGVIFYSGGNMRRLVINGLLAVAVAAVIGPSRAKADQITFGPSTSGTVSSDCLVPAATCTVSIGSISGVATFFNGTLTTGTFSLTGGSGTGSVFGGSNYALSGVTSTFTFTSSSGTLSGTVTWSVVQDPTNTETLIGTLSNVNCTSCTGSLNTDSWDGAQIDFTMTQNGPEGTWNISSGEVLPTPEPATLTLLGTGLLGLGGWFRRRKKS